MNSFPLVSLVKSQYLYCSMLEITVPVLSGLPAIYVCRTDIKRGFGMLFPAATAATRRNRRWGVEDMKENTKL